MPSRRRFLATVGAAGSVGVAGCTGDEYDDAATAAGGRRRHALDLA